jgi:protein gp37
VTASKIEWCDRSDWNPLRGCTRVSPGCGGPGPHGGCYAEAIAARFSDPGQPFHGFAERTKSGPRWTGRVELIEKRLTAPLRWRKPSRIFALSMSDLFHEAVTNETIDRIFAVMALCPQHQILVLTKRAERMRDYMSASNLPRRLEQAMDAITSVQPDHGGWPFRHLWLGVSVEDQARADERIPLLLETPAAVRWISAEPMLGPVDLTKIHGRWSAIWKDNAVGRPWLDWVVVGSESGRGARPCDLDWVRAIRDQCAAAGVALFWKQHVERGKKISTPELDGRQWVEYPQ